MLLGRIGYRFQQAWFLLFARMSAEDKAWVARNLNIREAALFNQLPGFEQKHAFAAAKELLRLAQGRCDWDQRSLAKLGLLHDVGKAVGRLSLMEKGALVFLNAFLPPVYNWFAYLGRKESAPPFLRKFYVHKKHARIGARMLSRAGVETGVVQLVSSHGDRLKKNAPLLQKLLREADEHYGG